MKYCFCLLISLFLSAGWLPAQNLFPQAMVPVLPETLEFAGEEVPLDRFDTRESLQRELSVTMYMHSRTIYALMRTTRYFPIIEPILKENGIPDDFKYLAVIESSLNPRATSSARAVGLWQFMQTTAREYGLTITPTVDERCHVEKSTRAACRYLRTAYEKYGDWAAVAASYNGGMGRISGELRKQDEESLFDLWLVEETTRYVYRVMAIKQIFEHPAKYGFIIRARDLYKPIPTKEVKVSRDIPDLAAFAKEQGITYADLRRFNPWLRDRKLLTGGKTYILAIPLASDLYYKTPNTRVHDPAWVVSEN